MGIYSKNSQPIKLYGEEADMFLENNGIFLFEDCVVLEGEQAEAYRKRKADEKAAAEKAEEERAGRRSDNTVGNRAVYNQDFDKFNKELGNDINRHRKTQDIYLREVRRRRKNQNKAIDDYYDAKGSDRIENKKALKNADKEMGNYLNSDYDVKSSVNRRLRREEKTGKKTFKESFIESIEFI